MSNGYIKLNRKMLDWGWYSEPVTKAVFLHLLLTANFRENEYKGITVKPGQVIVSLEKMAAKVGITVQQLRTALRKLEETGEISKKSTNKFTLITVEKWRVYQVSSSDEQQTSNKQITNEQQTNNKQITNEQQHLKNEKNVKNDNNVISNKETVCSSSSNNNNTRARARKLFEGYFERALNATEASEAVRLVRLYGEDLTAEAAKLAALNSNTRVPYVRGILENWKETGISSYSDYVDWDLKHSGIL